MAVALLAVVATARLSAQSPRLVSPADLAGVLDKAVLLDVRQSWTSYLQNHLPNAVWLSVETLRAQRAELPFQLLSGESYSILFRRLGVDPGRPVVVYSAGEQLDVDATFAVWLLASLGHRDVRLLDGGYARWELEGRPVTQRYPRHPRPPRFPADSFRPPVATLAEVEAAVRGSGALLVDARPVEQFNGSAGAQLRRGHIPGAINHPWKDDLEKSDHALVWKSVEALRESYSAQGITPDRDIILYCNSGTEASHVFFALKYLLGYPRVRIFPGSWTQWAEREELPIER